MSRTQFLQKVIEQLASSVRGQQIMILGSPQSGKTTALRYLKREIERQEHDWIVFDPIPASQFLSEAFFDLLSEWLISSEAVPEKLRLITGPNQTLSDFWRCVATVRYQNAQLRRVVLLIDDADQNVLGIERLATLLSSVRGFHEEWQEVDLNVHVIWAGSIIPTQLLLSFRERILASWPFTRDRSLLMLPDLSMEEILERLNQIRPDAKVRLVHAEYLYELTLGDVNAVSELLTLVGEQPINCATFLSASEHLIVSSEWGARLKSSISKLSERGRKQLAHLMLGQYVRTKPYDDLEDELILSGLVRVDETMNDRCLRLRSWLTEGGLRHHWHELGMISAEVPYCNHHELIPPIQCLNQRAFSIVCEIETVLRNLVVARLGRANNNGHPFAGLNFKERQSGDREDQLSRSKRWQSQVAGSKYVNAHAALVSYVNTTDLIDLIWHLLQQKDPVVLPLQGVHQRLAGFKEIRDVVMHGQIITEESLENLLEIRQELYSRLIVPQSGSDGLLNNSNAETL